jgi:hypothetical protein
MPVICGRTVAIVAICIGLPLFVIGCEGDKAQAAPPAASCEIIVNYPNVTLPRTGWFGYQASFKCKNHNPNSVRVTFQILRNGKQWAIMHAQTSPVQFTTECRRGGPVDKFRPRVSISVKTAGSGKPRFFTKTGPPYHWRCLPR